MTLRELVEDLTQLLAYGDCTVKIDEGTLVFDNGVKTRIVLDEGSPHNAV